MTDQTPTDFPNLTDLEWAVFEDLLRVEALSAEAAITAILNARTPEEKG